MAVLWTLCQDGSYNQNEPEDIVGAVWNPCYFKVWNFNGQTSDLPQNPHTSTTTYTPSPISPTLSVPHSVSHTHKFTYVHCFTVSPLPLQSSVQTSYRHVWQSEGQAATALLDWGTVAVERPTMSYNSSSTTLYNSSQFLHILSSPFFLSLHLSCCFFCLFFCFFVFACYVCPVLLWLHKPCYSTSLTL